ncbi:MAG: hypothetical protein JWO92_726 [Chitinophagaceae bacterium]|nr:hypothetical protein [Chitinophagaceae bacterium]
MAKPVIVSVKMFQVGELGDCFLLTFKEEGKESNVLIDCGSFRNSARSKTRLNTIVTYIKKQLGDKKLDIVAGTHQHNDHLSGFVHCEALFRGRIKQAWLSWLDDPKDSMARKIKKDQKSLVDTVRALQNKMNKPSMKSTREVLTDMLGFYNAAGSDPEIPAMGIEILKKIGENDVKYLSPGNSMDLPGLSSNAVKVYVLGPPKNQKLLFDKDPNKSETYDPNLAFANISATRFLSALENYSSGSKDRSEEQFPFNYEYKKTEAKADREIIRRYNNRNEGWRKIDNDWLQTASRLGLYLDSYTNNSSLVLAFELVKSGKVLLFAADAQTGNWLSWDQIKWNNMPVGFSSNDLLQNTVLYKVGHHASHNATLVKALESMQHPELVAMIPVDTSDPNIKKANGWKMPARNLYKRLKEKTNFRVLRMDDGYADGCDPVKNKDKSKWKDLPFKPKIDKGNFFIEYTIQG